jgi:hypothetical protein
VVSDDEDCAAAEGQGVGGGVWASARDAGGICGEEPIMSTMVDVADSLL